MRTQCECLTCHVCNGTGQIKVPNHGYRQDELERCDHCRGSGIEALCAFCAEQDVDAEGGA